MRDLPPADARVPATDRLQAFVQAFGELISAATPDGLLLWVNQAYADHFGQSVAALAGRNLFDFIAPADREAVRERLRHVVATRSSCQSENVMQAADGSLKVVAWTNFTLPDDNDRLVLYSVGRDITAQRAAEQAQRASEAFLERTGRVAGVGGWQLELASNELVWSQQTRRIHEVPPDFKPDVARAIDFYAEEARPRIQAAVERCLADGTPWDLELPLVTATGRRIWVRAVGEAQYHDGAVVRLLGAFQDITERWCLQEQLAARERFLQRMTDSIPIRIAYLDSDRRYQFVNRQALQQLGRPAEQVLGRTRAELVDDPNEALFAGRAQDALAGEAQRFEVEQAIDGDVRRFEHLLTPDLDANGRVVGYFVTGLDVTDRARAERRARELVDIVEHTPDFVVQTDWRGTVTYMNPAARVVAGLPAGALAAGLKFSDFNTRATNQRFADTVVPTVKAHGVWDGQNRIQAPSGQEVPVHQMVIGHRGPDGRIARYSSVMRDITKALRAEAEVRRQTEILRAVAESLPARIGVTDTQLHFHYANARFARWTGRSPADIIDRDLPGLLGDTAFAQHAGPITSALQGHAQHQELREGTPERPRSMAYDYLPLAGAGGRVDGLILIGQDVTARRLEEARLLHLSQRDPLTGLLNRAGLASTLAAWFAAYDPATLAVLYIDLDRFKAVNDVHGHPVGDALLQAFAKRLSAVTRPGDAVARLGGDEFVVAIAGLKDRASALQVANKIVALAEQPFEVVGVTLHLGSSVGVALGAPQGWESLIARADAALIQAKRQGRGRPVFESA